MPKHATHAMQCPQCGHPIEKGDQYHSVPVENLFSERVEQDIHPWCLVARLRQRPQSLVRLEMEQQQPTEERT